MTQGWGPTRLLPGTWASLKVASGPLDLALAEALAQRLRARHEAGQALRLALAGGQSPEAAYRRLGGMPLPWTALRLGFGDERVGPGEGEGSNWAMARAAFGAQACAQAQWRRFADSEAEEAHLREAGPYPLVLLGLGADGHTASLFPGEAALQDRTRLALDARGPEPWPDRRSLGPRALAEAGEVWVAVSGASKAEVVARLWAGEALAIRQALAGRSPAKTLFLLDAKAAAGLP